MNLHDVDRIANTLLYEGYILYPYRASAVKNRLRFNFGVVYPKAYAESQTGSDASAMQTECLVSGSASASVEIVVRFLRLVERLASDSVAESWQEAVEARIDLPELVVSQLCAAPVCHPFSFPAHEDRDMPKGDAVPVVRRCAQIDGGVEVSAEAEPAEGGLPADAWRLRIRILNTTLMRGAAAQNREIALQQSLLSTHTILSVKDGEFISLLDPPKEFSGAAARCRNEGTWPVLVGAATDKSPNKSPNKSMMLSSPIILYDYPAIAPESPGDLFDGTEIDEILTLRVLTMTDEEKREARGTDERARRILDRAESLDPEYFSKLHGTFRQTEGAG